MQQHLDRGSRLEKTCKPEDVAAGRRCRPCDRSIGQGRWRIFARTAGPGLTLRGLKIRIRLGLRYGSRVVRCFADRSTNVDVRETVERAPDAIALALATSS